MELLDQCTDESFCPPKRLGPFVCVPVLDSSSYPKARLMACKECYECVDMIGLSGIGKKGTLAAAKSLSEEKLLENRTALLDLMELLLSRMSGDIQRFARICGSSLSSKARDLLEERVNMVEKQKMATAQSRASPSRAAAIPAKKTIAPKIQSLPPSPRRPSLKSQNKNTSNSVPKQPYSTFGDSLPALGLRDSSPSGIPRPNTSSQAASSPTKLSETFRRSNSVTERSADDILSNLLDAEEMLGGSGGVPKSSEMEDPSSSGTTGTRLFAAPSSTQPSVSTSSETPELPSSSSDIGAAASLRARLLKIRDKNKGAPVDELSPTSNAVQSTSNDFGGATQNKTSDIGGFTNEAAVAATGSDDYEEEGFLQEDFNDDDALIAKAGSHLGNSLDTLSYLISKSTPVAEDDSDIFAATDILKTIHAAVSGQANLAVNMAPDEVTWLRAEIKERAKEVVASLTRYVQSKPFDSFGQPLFDF